MRGKTIAFSLEVLPPNHEHISYTPTLKLNLSRISKVFVLSPLLQFNFYEIISIFSLDATKLGCCPMKLYNIF